MKTALITGITGQDGSYLSELLLAKNYEVHGIIRRQSTDCTQRIDHLLHNSNLHLHYGDLTDSCNIFSLIKTVQPDEIYNLAAQSHVGISFEIPEYTAEVTGLGTIRILDAIKQLNKSIKFYQASTSELFGGIPGTEPQNELTPFTPRSPYAAAKLYSYWITKNYRESYGIFASNGILFNHESPRRGKDFVTRKISIGVSKIFHGLQDKISLGNLDAKRDWGFAGDYVEGMYRILQLDHPDDFVLATNETHTVREFVELAFKEIDINITWKNSGVDEVGIDSNTGKILVDVNPKFFRPSEVDILLGDPSKAEHVLNWKRTVEFKQLVSMMIQADLKVVNDARY